MKKRTKFSILAATLSVAVGICTTAGIIALADDQREVGLDGVLAERALIGEEVAVPSYYAQSGNEVVKAVANIITPSGNAYAGSKFTVTEGGRYVVEYTVNGAVVHTEDCLGVLGSADLFKTNALASVDGVANYKYNTDDAYKGVAVNVNSGATITFDREIDMANLTKDDILFEGTVEPTQQGEADFMQMVLTFTDVEDESSYFRLTITDGHADGGSPKHVIYVNGAANGQTAGGMNYDSGIPFWQAKDIYGTSSPSSFRAERLNGYSLYSIKLFYEAKENAIYMPTYENKMLLVVDFDDPVVFGGNVWSGFKSGKANLGVSFIGVNETGGRVIFNEIGGLRLTENEIVDTVAPQIKVDLDGEKKAPNALLGTTYSIFPCTTYDFFDLNVQVDTTVTYENIFTGAKSDIVVRDGKFVTDKLGKYTIRYVATDYTGNSSVEEYSFECIANAEEIVLTNVAEDIATQAFKEVIVPDVSTIRAFGGNGSLKITMAVTDCDGEEIEVKDNAFIPVKVGDYKVIYTATDYYGESASSVVTVRVTENEETAFMNDIVLPELLIAGFEYTLPEIQAYTCYNGEVVNCEMVYLVNGVALNETRTFIADSSSAQASIVCRALKGDNIVCGEISKTLLVIDGDHGRNQAAYFYDNTATVQVTETQESIDLTASKDASVSFVNKLKASAFTLGMNYVLEDCKFNSFNVTLTDATKSDVTVTFKFTFTKENVKITTPYGAETIFPSAEGYFELNFNSESCIVSDASNTSVTFVDVDDKGNKFSGFSDGLYATFSFEGVVKESKISLSLLNNQPLGFRGETDEEIKDTKGPEIQTKEELSTRVKLGDEYTVYSALASDVLSQVTSTTVKVVSPSGKEVVAETNADKDITFTTTEIGTYKVYYYSYDSEGNRTRLGQNVRVIDSIAPTLDVSYADMTKKVGDTLELPLVTAVDDSDTVYYDIFLSLPNSEMRMLVHSEDGVATYYYGEQFTLEMKGKYVLTVMAYDKQYNLTMQSFTIRAK